jgi:S-adenosylmethionine hydrolase
MPTRAPVITLLTDFGHRDAYAGIMKGVMLGICPTARLVDLTHDVPPQAVRLGALVLRSAVPYFPPGAMHVAVVDPGVGSARDPIAVFSERGILVGPDNGLLAPAAAVLGPHTVRRLENPALFHQPVSDTFHGRDIFAPVAAHLAAGTAPASVGSELASLRRLDLPEASVGRDAIDGEVIHVDHFGNLITNIAASVLDAFPAHTLSVRIATMTRVPVARTYAVVAPGHTVAVIGSWGLLEIAVREGSAAAQLGAGAGTPVRVAGE